jgi:hypothetical protein
MNHVCVFSKIYICIQSHSIVVAEDKKELRKYLHHFSTFIKTPRGNVQAGYAKLYSRLSMTEVLVGKDQNFLRKKLLREGKYVMKKIEVTFQVS